MDKPIKKHPIERMYVYEEIVHYIEEKYKVTLTQRKDVNDITFDMWVMDGHDDEIPNLVTIEVQAGINDECTPEHIKQILKYIEEEGFCDDIHIFKAWMNP